MKFVIVTLLITSITAFLIFYNVSEIHPISEVDLCVIPCCRHPNGDCSLVIVTPVLEYCTFLYEIVAATHIVVMKHKDAG